MRSACVGWRYKNWTDIDKHDTETYHCRIKNKIANKIVFPAKCLTVPQRSRDCFAGNQDKIAWQKPPFPWHDTLWDCGISPKYVVLMWLYGQSLELPLELTATFDRVVSLVLRQYHGDHAVQLRIYVTSTSVEPHYTNIPVVFHLFHKKKRMSVHIKMFKNAHGTMTSRWILNTPLHLLEQ